MSSSPNLNLVPCPCCAGRARWVYGGRQPPVAQRVPAMLPDHMQHKAHHLLLTCAFDTASQAVREGRVPGMTLPEPEADKRAVGAEAARGERGRRPRSPTASGAALVNIHPRAMGC